MPNKPVKHKKLPLTYYQQDDVVRLAEDLIGRYIYTQIEGERTGGIIVETEAYRGPEDMGSHAYMGKRTTRNEMMYAAGGCIYMYICYGIHNMLNIVTGPKGCSHAILIRAIYPSEGQNIMHQRRGDNIQNYKLASGPGSVAKALGLRKIHDGLFLNSKEIWISEDKIEMEESAIIKAPRIGLNIPEPFKSIAWRFYLKGNRAVSKTIKETV